MTRGCCSRRPSTRSCARPTRLRSLLELCAQVATLRVERIWIGPADDVEQVAEAIERRIGTAP